MYAYDCAQVLLLLLLLLLLAESEVRNQMLCYTDLAVGAPYEGRGAVYIFRGSARGILPTYSQRIIARGFPSVTGNMRAFGASLSASPADLDNNGYPDVVVGAFASNAVVILRARPVVKITAQVR